MEQNNSITLIDRVDRSKSFALEQLRQRRRQVDSQLKKCIPTAVLCEVILNLSDPLEVSVYIAPVEFVNWGPLRDPQNLCYLKPEHSKLVVNQLLLHLSLHYYILSPLSKYPRDHEIILIGSSGQGWKRVPTFSWAPDFVYSIIIRNRLMVEFCDDDNSRLLGACHLASLAQQTLVTYRLYQQYVPDVDEAAYLVQFNPAQELSLLSKKKQVKQNLRCTVS